MKKLSSSSSKTSLSFCFYITIIVFTCSIFFYIHQKSILQNYFLFFPCAKKSLNNNFSKKLSTKFLKNITTYILFKNNYMNTQTLFLIDASTLNLNQTHSMFNKQISCTISFSTILKKFNSLTNLQFEHFLSVQFFSEMKNKKKVLSGKQTKASIFWHGFNLTKGNSLTIFSYKFN